jgi:hypothetical protein
MSKIFAAVMVALSHWFLLDRGFELPNILPCERLLELRNAPLAPTAAETPRDSIAPV